jgi:hypothetical protein
MDNLSQTFFLYKEQILKIESAYAHALATPLQKTPHLIHTLNEAQALIDDQLIAVYWGAFIDLYPSSNGSISEPSDWGLPHGLSPNARRLLWVRVFDDLALQYMRPHVTFNPDLSARFKVNPNTSETMREWGLSFERYPVERTSEHLVAQLITACQEIQTIATSAQGVLNFLEGGDERRQDTSNTGIAFERLVKTLVNLSSESLRAISPEHDRLWTHRALPKLSCRAAPLSLDVLGGADLSIRRPRPQAARGWLQVSLSAELKRGDAKERARRSAGCFWCLSPYTLAFDLSPDHSLWRHAAHTPSTIQGRAYAVRAWVMTALKERVRHPLGPIGALPAPLSWQMLSSIHQRLGVPTRRKIKKIKRAPTLSLTPAQSTELEAHLNAHLNAHLKL